MRRLLAALALIPALIGCGSATINVRQYHVRVGQASQTAQEVLADQIATQPTDRPDDMTLLRAPSLSVEQIDAILVGSPASGSGADFYNLGVQYGIDPAYALAFFIHESGAGTNPSWAGIKPDGSTTHDIGNIICAGYPTCYGRFRDYGSWSEGIEDWYRLIKNEYIIGRGLTTVEQVIPIYAPSFENDVDGYTNAVSATVAGWRKASQDIRAQVVQLALQQVGKPYILGTQGPNTFDCSGLVQWIYAHYGIDTGRTTFDQLPKLKSIEPSQIQPGDLVYFQYPWDQHTGILADLDGDGRWDMIQAAAPELGVIVTNNVFADKFYTDAIIGYRSAL